LVDAKLTSKDLCSNFILVKKRIATLCYFEISIFVKN
jgi:hypothetical protein